jgi:hypothetical protein
MKCVDNFSKKFKFIYIDTVKHDDSLMEELLGDPDWHSARLEACDDNLNPTCPSLLSKAELEREYDSHKRKGRLTIFYMEYRNSVIAPEEQSFTEDMFHNYDVLDESLWTSCEHFVLVDPAKTVESTSADSAVVGVSVDYLKNRIYVRDIVAGKLYPNEVYSHAIAMALRLGAHTLGVEVTGLNEFIKQPLINELSTKGLLGKLEVVWLEARGGTKEESGQLLMFPRGKLVDIADCLSYAVELLEKGERYFTPPEEELPDYDADEAMYKKIDYDEPLVYDSWQRI